MIARLVVHAQAHRSTHCALCVLFVVLYLVHVPLHALGLEAGWMDMALTQLQMAVVVSRD